MMNRQEFVQSISLSRSPSEFFFQLGYVGQNIPRLLRKLCAKSRYHASWLSGYYGGGVCGVMERQQWKSITSCADPDYNNTPVLHEIGISGLKAGLAGKPASDNPYPQGDWKGELWEDERMGGIGRTHVSDYT